MEKINYRYEYNGNPDYVTIHFTFKVTENTFVSRIINEGNDSDKQLLTLLKGAMGAFEPTLRTYSISAQRGTAFDRDTVLNNLLEIFKMWIEMNFSKYEFVQLPTLRTDIAMTKCAMCKADEEIEYKRLARDIDTLEY